MIKKFKDFKESLSIDLNYTNIEDLSESMNIWYDSLLDSVSAEMLDIKDELKLEQPKLKDLDILSKNTEFINSLSSLGLRKSEVKNSSDYETFMNKPFKFMFIYDFNASELENPEYLLFQLWNDTLKEWSDINLYKVNDDAKKFYDKLSSKTIEIIDGDDNYIYTTSNGNEWELQNINLENDFYLKIMRNDELQNMLKDKKVKINII
jgi:hypothetical protein